MTSFDAVGNIVIFSEEFKGIKEEAKRLLKELKNIETVAVKTKQHSGIYRTKKVKIIAGKKSKETIHKENNVKVKLNIETCYFSPRLSNERLRIAKQIKKDEIILCMFSGVGIYPLVFAKNSKAKEIYGVEINPNCHKYALENLKLNKIKNIKLYNSDVKKVLPKIRKKFDRIVMPLPKNAEDFLDVAVKKIKNNGIIHFYDFERGIDIPKKTIEKIRDKIKKFKILRIIKCGSYGPDKFRVCADLIVYLN